MGGSCSSYGPQPHLPLHGVLPLVLLVLLAAARRRQQRRSSCPGQMPWAREATTAWRSNHPPITTGHCLAGREAPARRCAQPGMAQRRTVFTLKAKMLRPWPVPRRPTTPAAPRRSRRQAARRPCPGRRMPPRRLTWEAARRPFRGRRALPLCLAVPATLLPVRCAAPRRHSGVAARHHC